MPTRSAARSAKTCARALERLPLNRTLTTIKTDVALDFAPTDLVLRERHVDDLRALYARYGFKQALRELGGADTSAPDSASGRGGSMRSTEAGYARAATPAAEALDPALAAPGEYECILTQAQLDAWIGRLQARRCVRVRLRDRFARPDARAAGRPELRGRNRATAAYLPLGAYLSRRAAATRTRRDARHC